MNWLQAILELLKAIPILDRWFTKTATEKVEDGEKKIQKDMDHLKDEGRPSW